MSETLGGGNRLGVVSGVVALAINIAGCSSDEEGVLTADLCATEPPGGQWDPTNPTEGSVIDWSDPGVQPGEPPKSGEWSDIVPHHISTVAVHAAHMPTGDLLLFHGANEERLWPIGAAATAMTWHPVPDPFSSEEMDLCSFEANVLPAGGRCYPSIFCAGHVLLPDGRFFVAGGNVTGRPDGGGLVNTYIFDPTNAYPGVYPYGWNRSEDMDVDRWYPTLTVLPDGRVLISSGTSRPLDGDDQVQDAGNAGRFEVYDPMTDTMNELTIGGSVPFDSLNVMPLYPFMFVLPSGDIFYAGGENANPTQSQGRVLIADYADDSNWTWSSRVFTSTINGGSAVMYEPGQIMKSGGLQHSGNLLAQATTEIIDLSLENVPDQVNHDYSGAPNFYTTSAMDMEVARHFHSLTLLPDGRVLATGGNARATGEPGDHFQNPCEYNNAQIASVACSDVDNDGTPDDLSTVAVAAGCPAVPSLCIGGTCPFLGQSSTCTTSADCGSECSDDDECPPGSTCNMALQEPRCEMPCSYAPTMMCGAAIECTTNVGGSCEPAKNECHATMTAEVWDPLCKTWTEFGAELSPRMYHSTAMLLPDGRVISMGGGHQDPWLAEQESAQYFEPEYGLAGTAFVPQITVVGETNVPGDAPALPYGGSI